MTHMYICILLICICEAPHYRWRLSILNFWKKNDKDEGCGLGETVPTDGYIRHIVIKFLRTKFSITVVLHEYLL